MSWLTIESDPAVFTTLIADLGVKDVIVKELFSVDADALNSLRPNYGLIFLFKYQSEAPKASSQRVSSSELDQDVWFAHQKIQNACGTQAILAILLNQPDLDLGPELSTFKDFTQQFPPDLRGETMTNSNLLRQVHNSFSRSEMFHRDPDEAPQADGEAAYHFVSYTEINGHLYELDGLQPEPINHGECQDLGLKLQTVLQERIARYQTDELHFSLLGLTKDPLADGGKNLTDYERIQEQQSHTDRNREVALRRHGFASAIVTLTKALLRHRSPSAVEELIRTGKERAQLKKTTKSDTSQ